MPSVAGNETFRQAWPMSNKYQIPVLGQNLEFLSLKRMRNCRQISELLSQQQDDAAPLPWTTRLDLRFHLLMCAWCRGFARQLKVLRQLAHRYGDAEESAAGKGVELSADQKSRLKERIEHLLRQGSQDK